MAGGRNWRIGELPPFVYDVGQVFQVGITGTLDRVEVYLDKKGSPIANMTLDVRPTTAGVPNTGGVLGSVSVLPAAIPDIGVGGGYVVFDLSGAGIAVTTGDVLAFVLSSSQNFSGNVNEYVAYSGASYAGGSVYHGDIDAGTAGERFPDLAFRTYVDTGVAAVPEPGALAVWAVLGSLGLIVVRRRRNRG